jgi:DNA-binding NtrC family response regulator
MSEAMQARLLRVLQEGEIRRVGSNEVLKVDARVIAATNVDLRERVQAGRFREDLYYRLKVVELELPPLRRRAGDVRLLAEHFLEQEALEAARLPRSLTPEALEMLEACPWPGNVRELRNEMRRVSLLGEGPVRPDDLSAEVRRSALEVTSPVPGAEAGLPARVAALEIAAIREALSAEQGSKPRAATRLGIDRFKLQRLIERHRDHFPELARRRTGADEPSAED